MMMSPALLTRSTAAALAALAFVSCQSSTPPDRFAQADGDGNGTLSPAEVSDYFVGGVFDERDTNKDGKITKAEWNPAMDAAESKEFDLRDANRDGVVTRAEATAFARRQGLYASVTREADTNKDGVLTREEARAYYASKE
jgi:hypothetical protein